MPMKKSWRGLNRQHRRQRARRQHNLQQRQRSQQFLQLNPQEPSER